VRVEIDSFREDGLPATADAAIFTFASGRRERLDFQLFRACLATQCATTNTTCGDNGLCASLQLRAAEDRPDLAVSLPKQPPSRTSIQLFPTVGGVPPPSFTQPGDRMLFLTVFGSCHPPQDEWQRIAADGLFLPGGGAIELWTRIAASDESQRIATYTIGPSCPQTGINSFLLLAYRNAGLPTNTVWTIATDMFTYPALSGLAPGSLVTRIHFPGGPSCTTTPPLPNLAGNNLDHVFFVYETSADGTGASTAFNMNCPPANSTGAAIEVVIPPL
jgi:hypothetical protein